MKVLFSAHCFVEYDGKNYFHSPILQTFIDRYKRDGVELTIICYKNDEVNSSYHRYDNENVRYVFVNKANSISDILKKSFCSDIKVIRNEVERADACIVHVPCRISCQIIKYAKRLGVPYMTVVVACPWDAYWNYGLKGKLVAPWQYLSLRTIQKKAPWSIYVTKTFLQSRYPCKGRTLVCSNVDIKVSDDFIIEERLKRIDEKGIKNLRICTTASVNIPFKGQEDVIRALAMIKNLKYEYHLIGNGEPSRLMNIVSEEGMEDRVVFHGGISHDAVLHLLDEMDVYIQPSKQEGLPRALIEAMSRGCLCFGSNIAGIPELLNSKYLFKKGNVKEIASLIEGVTPDMLRRECVYNVNVSRGYDKGTLDNRRNSFINKFYNSL